METIWTIMPFVDCWEQTQQAVHDVLKQQGVETRLLLIDNGSSAETRQLVEQHTVPPAVLVWHHDPPMSSLAATWNAALDFVWAAGGDCAWVCNNDVRLHRDTVWFLRDIQVATNALFVSAVGVTGEQFYAATVSAKRDIIHGNEIVFDPAARGGPDFSCYLISKECHELKRFDENFTPAYCEDLDYHRRLMLAGEGSRIFSINVPYLHVDNGSGTLKSWEPERRARFEEQVGKGSRRYYELKWGGPVNEERFLFPFEAVGDPAHAFIDHCPQGCVTTPQLQAHGCGGRA